MKYRTARCTTVAVLALALFALLGPGTALAEIRFGVLPRLGAMELHTMFSPLAEYLTKETGEKVSLVIPKDFATFKLAVKAGQMDMGFANSLVYVQLKADQDLEPLVVASEPKSGTRFRGIIIARKDSLITKVHDLRGKKLSFVDKDSAAGYVFQMLLLSKAGLDVHKDFTTLPFATKHDNVTIAVFSKAADAGGIREEDLNKMKDKVDLSQIRIVAHTDYFPNWPVFSTAKMNKETAAKIKAALLKLRPNSPMSKKVLRAAQLTGFALVSDSDYDGLRKAARLAGAL